MPLHPQAEVMLGAMSGAGFDLGPGADPADVRAVIDGMLGAAPGPPVHRTEDRAAGSVPIRVYWPSDDAGLPILVWFHGGGWVIGSLDTHDGTCRNLCNDAGVIVVSVDYRLAPEHKFPAAVDDCVAAWTWVNEHAAELGGDNTRVALGGDSAGGNLAAVVSLIAREERLPVPALQLLVYPVTDYEFESPSMVDNATGYFLEAEGMRWFFGHYGRSGADYDDWRCCPLRAADHSSLPRAVVITAEFDPLRDQGEAYGRRLQQSGCDVEILRVDGVFHGFFGMHAFLDPAQQPWDLTVASMQDVFGMGAA
ncbi:MAG TPA: alpha/beta hydrolase [Acidimicrobiia bacterium]|nr:alpha/beta hydrolase [Acidimicrobiia bacterium]